MGQTTLRRSQPWGHLSPGLLASRDGTGSISVHLSHPGLWSSATATPGKIQVVRVRP